MNRLVLDTNAYTGQFKGDVKIKETIEKATSIFLPVIAVGELLAAFKAGNRESANKKLLEKFLDHPIVSLIEVSAETADIYASIKYSLRKKGTPVPINDVWIAACVMQAGAVLVTYDEHFLKIPGLRVWDEIKE